MALITSVYVIVRSLSINGPNHLGLCALSEYFEIFKYVNFDLTMLMKTWGCKNPIFATFYVKFLVVTMIPLTAISIIFVHWRVGQMQLEGKRKNAAVKPTQLECVVEDIDWRGNCMSRVFFTLVLLYLKVSPHG